MHDSARQPEMGHLDHSVVCFAGSAVEGLCAQVGNRHQAALGAHVHAVGIADVEQALLQRICWLTDWTSLPSCVANAHGAGMCVPPLSTGNLCMSAPWWQQGPAVPRGIPDLCNAPACWFPSSTAIAEPQTLCKHAAC